RPRRFRRAELSRGRPLSVRRSRHAPRRGRRARCHRGDGPAMIDIWTVVRFLHVVGAIVWVGGQLTVTLIVLPPAHRLLSVPDRAQVLRNVGRRFALVTFAMFLPVQITTGVLLAVRHGVTWTSLSEPGYGRVLIVKVL